MHQMAVNGPQPVLSGGAAPSGSPSNPSVLLSVVHSTRVFSFIPSFPTCVCVLRVLVAPLHRCRCLFVVFLNNSCVLAFTYGRARACLPDCERAAALHISPPIPSPALARTPDREQR